jgi:carbon storage regulator
MRHWKWVGAVWGNKEVHQHQTQKKGVQAMLVLSRKPGERIMIGNDVTVTIVRIGPNTVRLGIDAPSHLNIVREELVADVVTTESEFPSNAEQSGHRRYPR